MMYDTIIVNGEVITERAVEAVDLAIKDGKITAVVARGTPLEASEIIDARGHYVMPGAVDIHFHCRAPAYPDRGDFATETRAAAAGGVTTIFEMPISKPCCATGEIFRARRALGEANAYVNFALFGAPGLLKPEEVHAMADEGAIGYKIFMTSAPAGRDDEFDGLCLPNVEKLYQGMKLVAETGLVCAVHAEDNALLEWHTAQLKAAGRNDVLAHNESRPPHVEALAIATLMTLNESVGVNLHIVHLSSYEALEVFRRFKRTGSTASAETCTHYLLFTEADMERTGPYAKINPPLRTQMDQDALWGGLQDRTLMAITTDHSPFTAEEKERARTDIWRTPPGSPGVEELVLSVMDAALTGKLDLLHAVQLISTNGAKRYGIYPQKGTLAIGADADIVLYDPREATTIHQDMLFSKAKACDKLYEGMTFQGKVRRTLVNGRTVFENGEIKGQPGWGKFVRPIRENVDKGF